MDFTDTSPIRLADDNSVLDSSDDEDDVPLSNLLKNRRDGKQSQTTRDQTLSSEAPQTQDEVLDSSDDEDDVPLSNLLKNRRDGKQSQTTRDQTLSSEAPQTQDEDSSSDEGRLTERTRKAAEIQNQLKGRRTEKTPVLDSSDDEDDVPLVNLLKKPKEEKLSEKTGGQTLSSEAPQTTREDDSSDDEPLSKYRKPLPAKETETDLNRSKGRRRVYKRTVSSSGDSDSEPGKRIKSPSARRPSSKSVETKPQTRPEPQRPRSSDGSSDEDVPLGNLIRKWDQTTTKIKTKNKTRIKTTPAQRSASKPTARMNETHVIAAESSDDEPLSNLLRRLKGAANSSPPHGDNTRPKKRGQTPTKNHKGPSRKFTVPTNKKRLACKNGSLSDGSGDEPRLKVAKHPLVPMFLKVMVERC